MKHQSALWRIGGAQGHGIDSASSLFARGCARMGFNVLSRREYHSNIMGRHSYSDVRITNWPAGGHCASPGILVCLDSEALYRHINSVTSAGIIVIDSAETTVDMNTLKYLDAELKIQLHIQLAQANQPPTVSGLIESQANPSLTVVKVPFNEFRKILQEEFSISKSLASRSKNIALVAASAALLNIPEKIVASEIELLFSEKKSVIQISHKAISLAYNYVKSLKIKLPETLPEHTKLKRLKPEQQHLLINGFQSIALGKLAAGMGMQPYYPISPATDESEYLELYKTVPVTHGESAGPVIIQTEDELAAITMACGAALTGARVSTSTSGPGFSLMVEGLGWAGMTETPVVVTLYQRGGPSTGMPTRTEQGDLQFVLHAGHGEFPRVVLASADVGECFYDSFRAFNYAERYQLPVIHLLDKNLANTTQTLLPFNTDELYIDKGELAQADKNNKHLPRFELNDSGLSPRPRLGKKGQLFWSTGVEHSEWGQVSENPDLRRSMLDKRARKLQLVLTEIPLEEKLCVYGDTQAKLTIISWGSNKGVIVDTVEKLIAEGKPVRAIIVKLLWPFPAEELNKLIRNDDTVVVLECNQSGQFNCLLKEQMGQGADYLLLKYTGRPFLLEDVMHHLGNIMSGNAEKITSVGKD